MLAAMYGSPCLQDHADGLQPKIAILKVELPEVEQYTDTALQCGFDG